MFVPGVLAASGGICRGDLVAVCAAVERGCSGKGCGITRGTVLPLRPPAWAPGAEADGTSLQSTEPEGYARSVHPASEPPAATCSQEPPALPARRYYVGVGRAAMSRAEMFREEQGVAIHMETPVYRVPSVQGGFSGLQSDDPKDLQA